MGQSVYMTKEESVTMRLNCINWLNNKGKNIKYYTILCSTYPKHKIYDLTKYCQSHCLLTNTHTHSCARAMRPQNIKVFRRL